MRIAVVTDAYYPHVSGIARVLQETQKALTARGHAVLIISPADFSYRVALPLYPEIKLPLFMRRRLARLLDEFHPDTLHIATEGPLGFSARAYAKRRKYRYTTAYHTRLPEYAHEYLRVSPGRVYRFLRSFHAGAERTFVSTDSLKYELEGRGFKRLVTIPFGVDTETFRPDNPYPLTDARPIFMYMGRVAKEKNLRAFLSLDLPGTKYVVGDGPARRALKRTYPDVRFTGYVFGDDLARHIAAADVFVFPSLTDTLGLVMLEANACGVPVAALPSEAARAIIEEGKNGAIAEDLREACLTALTFSRAECRKTAERYSWQHSTDAFLANLVPLAD